MAAAACTAWPMRSPPTKKIRTSLVWVQGSVPRLSPDRVVSQAWAATRAAVSDSAAVAQVMSELEMSWIDGGFAAAGLPAAGLPVPLVGRVTAGGWSTQEVLARQR